MSVNDELHRPAFDHELPGELDIDLEAARNAIGTIVEMLDTDAIGVVVGCCVAAEDGEDVWTVRSEFRTWHETHAGDFKIIGHVGVDRRIDWEV